MAFVPENELEKVLMRASSDPSARPEFYRLLLESVLYAVGERDQPAAAGQIFAKVGEKLKIASLPHPDGAFIPVFSSLSRLQDFLQEPRGYLALDGRSLLEMTRGAFLVLNPGAQYGKKLPPAEIELLLHTA